MMCQSLCVVLHPCHLLTFLKTASIRAAFVCCTGRQRGAFVDRPRSAPPAAPGAGKDPMIDALAERDEHEEALCAV